MNRIVRTVFLASPRDLEDERSVVRDVVRRLNKVSARRTGIELEVVGWEDTLPGRGRPQSLINPSLIDCDLFIGLLHRRWGSSTGKYSSGFEEEFSIARDRSEKTGRPDIWLFFKAVDEVSVNDPGPELQRVLQFKKQIADEHQLLFKEFGDDEWQNLIYDLLLEYVLSQREIQEMPSGVSAEAPIRESEQAAVQPDLLSSTASETSSDQLIAIFRRLASDGPDDTALSLTFAERARLLMVTTSWFSEVHAGDVLGVHESNIAYRLRSEWNLSEQELLLLVRTGVADRSDLIPWWYWIHRIKDHDVDRLLSMLAEKARLAHVRAGSFSLLGRAGRFVPEETLEAGILDEDHTVVLAAVRLARVIGSPVYLKSLERASELADEAIRNEVAAAQAEIHFKQSAPEALGFLIRTRIRVPESLQDPAKWSAAGIEPNSILPALDAGEPTLRLLAARFLRLNGAMTVDLCNKLLQDPHTDLRREGLLGLADLGVEFDLGELPGVLGPFGLLDDDIELEMLRRRSPESLLRMIHWNSPNGYGAYRVLAVEHFDKVKGRIMEDLENEFEGLRAEAQLGEMSSRARSSSIRLGDAIKMHQIDEFRRDKYVAAALAGLERNGDPENVRHGRRFVDRVKMRSSVSEAVKLLIKWGNGSDSVRLMELATQFHGDTRREVVRAAIELSDNLRESLLKTISLGDSEIIAAAVPSSKLLQKKDKLDLAERLLQSDDAAIRKLGVATLCETVPDEELKGKLGEYVGRQSYYYNVVAWLDRCLFAPRAYRESYRRELRKLVRI